VSVQVEEWTATCTDVPELDCRGVAALFINNLARSGGGVFDASDGMVAVVRRSACPAGIPEFFDPTSCWEATASGPHGPVCMIIAASRPAATPPIPPFGQVGGDDMSGAFGGPPAEWLPCE
jgi:hypothetical protein